MILGLSTGLFTGIHVVLSLLGIATGFMVLFSMIGNRKSAAWTAWFFISNILTDVTGFLFPFKGITPAIILGGLSLVVLLVALIGYYIKRLAGGWRGRYVVAAAVALYFNVFVLIVQSFEKIGPLKAIAPTQASPAFGIAQLIGLGLIVLLTVIAYRRFKPAVRTNALEEAVK
ncbi:hypothetical protein [Occallatibacter riparius]|uniref:Uncharacterized protein n=1 Tax=Occallatibacter riparius TaxID=1002689 RepID=A0A9J7BPY0_9BACT|nr:hypothetical protein [Occallatibacter riparius]UWZ83802.1 hypothetical protein MOP44_24965 [Occallatibacter riparius]